MENLSKLKDPNLVIAWLNQINFRVCYNMSRKRRRYDRELTDYNDAIARQITSSRLSTHETDPETVIIQIDSREYIINQVLKLPFTEAQVIILKYYQNMKQDEIAHLMDISRSSVKRYLSSGLKRLENMLQSGGELTS